MTYIRSVGMATDQQQAISHLSANQRHVAPTGGDATLTTDMAWPLQGF